MSTTCSKCGASAERDQRFCGSCGAPIENHQPRKQRGRGCIGCLAALVLAVLVLGVLSALGGQAKTTTNAPPERASEQVTGVTEEAIASGEGAAEPEATPSPEVAAHTTVRANFRSGPSTDFTPYLKLEPGEVVSLIAVHQAKGETWYRAAYGDMTGWLSSTVLDVGEQAAASLPSFGAVVDAAQAGDEAVRSYLGTTAFNMQLIAEAMGNFGVLFTEPRPLDKDWVQSVQAQFLAIRVAHRVQSDIDPVPAPVISLQEQVVDTTGTCEQMTYPLEEGMLALDAERLKEALPLSKSCENKITALMVQLKTATGDE